MTKRKRQVDQVQEEPAKPVDLDFRSSLDSLQALLNYDFNDLSLLEEALTHPSYMNSPSYQRLEFLGDATLGLALANFVFISYRDHGPGDLSLLRAANISTEKFARVAVRHGLFKYVRHSSPPLGDMVARFCEAIQDEGDEMLPYGGSVKAPKVLADIVESIAGALYEDCNFDLKMLWEHFSPLLEPIVTMESLTQQPVTMLNELCQKRGRELKFEYWQDGTKVVTDVYLDGSLQASASSENKEISKLSAVKIVLQKLGSEPVQVELSDCESTNHEETVEVNHEEIVGAKQKLYEHCNNKKNQCSSKPSYRLVKEEGPSHDKKFVCCVRIESSQGIKETAGEPKPKVRDAESSAASKMLYLLKAAC